MVWCLLPFCADDALAGSAIQESCVPVGMYIDRMIRITAADVVMMMMVVQQQQQRNKKARPKREAATSTALALVTFIIRAPRHRAREKLLSISQRFSRAPFFQLFLLNLVQHETIPG